MFIPKGFRETERVDFVVHFHGWRNTVADTLQQFKLVEQLVASGKNAVLIVPEGPRNAPDSAGGKLEDREGFKRFMDEAMVTLRQRGVFKSDFVFGGHHSFRPQRRLSGDVGHCGSRRTDARR